MKYIVYCKVDWEDTRRILVHTFNERTSTWNGNRFQDELPGVVPRLVSKEEAEAIVGVEQGSYSGIVFEYCEAPQQGPVQELIDFNEI